MYLSCTRRFSRPQAQNVAYVHTKMVSKKSVCVRIDHNVNIHPTIISYHTEPTHFLGVRGHSYFVHCTASLLRSRIDTLFAPGTRWHLR